MIILDLKPQMSLPVYYIGMMNYLLCQLSWYPYSILTFNNETSGNRECLASAFLRTINLFFTELNESEYLNSQG